MRLGRCCASIAAFCLLSALGACTKSSEQLEQERAAREATMRQAIAESLAEERAKDQRMRESAAAEAGEHVARDTEQFEAERAKLAAQSREGTEPGQPDVSDALRKYVDRLQQFVNDPGSLQLRNTELSPKQNGMCAEFNAKDKAGAYAGFKRVVVTDTAVNPEEPPNRDTLTYFLAFQVAARDTGCFPDVQKVRILR